MRPLLHLLSILLVLPSVALAGALSLLGHAIATHSLLGFLDELLTLFLWLVPWGALAICAALLALVVSGFSPRWRWLAALCVAVLAIGSSAVILALTAHAGISAGQIWFFIPAIVSAALALWLTTTEFPRGQRSPSATP